MSLYSIKTIIDNNIIIHIIISLFLVSYVILARPELPSYIVKIFENPLFRLVVISYILYESNNDLLLSVLVTFSFLLIMYLINKQNVKEMFKTCNCNKSDKNCSCKMLTT